MPDWIAWLLRPRTMRIDVASFSECGPVRAENQDHVFVGGRTVFCVADGMGGGEGGAKASEIVCDAVAKSYSRSAAFADSVGSADDAVRRADREVRDYASGRGYRQMGSTAAVLVLDAAGTRAAVGNIGDSRVYRLRGGELKQLTRDHTVESELLRRAGQRVSSGFANMRATAFAHMLTRAVGIGEEAALEWCEIDVRAGDVFLLCSDGVYGYSRPDGLKGALARGSDAGDVPERLKRLVRAGGAGDNFSAIVVKTRGL